MGCDIHLHCEYRKNGIWYNCDNFEWNQETGQYEFVSIYSDRNYILFGVLAGVRSNEPEKIDSPRGLPDDIALKTKELADLDFKWTHSHSYLTLRELLKWRERQQKKWKKLKKKNGVKCDDYEGEYILENDEYPIFKWKKNILNELIQKMEYKMDDHLFCFGEDDYYEQGDDFRIIFWFDS